MEVTRGFFQYSWRFATSAVRTGIQEGRTSPFAQATVLLTCLFSVLAIILHHLFGLLSFLPTTSASIGLLSFGIGLVLWYKRAGVNVPPDSSRGRVIVLSNSAGLDECMLVCFALSNVAGAFFLKDCLLYPPAGIDLIFWGVLAASVMPTVFAWRCVVYANHIPLRHVNSWLFRACASFALLLYLLERVS